jgi:SAM-dependent methyltransferase
MLMACFPERRNLMVSGTNFGKAAGDYGTFRAGFPESIFDRLAEFKVGLPNQTLIDLGTGTGTLARGFALRGCKVVGVDPDPRMIDQARKLDGQSEVHIRYVEAKAESTGMDGGAADVVTAGQLTWMCPTRRRHGEAESGQVRALLPWTKTQPVSLMRTIRSYFPLGFQRVFSPYRIVFSR